MKKIKEFIIKTKNEKVFDEMLKAINCNDKENVSVEIIIASDRKKNKPHFNRNHAENKKMKTGIDKQLTL